MRLPATTGYPWPGLPPTVFMALFMVAGVWLAHGLRPWLTSPWPWHLWAAAGLAGVVMAARWVRPAVPWNPGEPARWSPARGRLAVLWGAVGCLALGGAQYAGYVHRVETALPGWALDGAAPVHLRGVVTEVLAPPALAPSAADGPGSRQPVPRFRMAVHAVGQGAPGSLRTGAVSWQAAAPGARVEVRVAPVQIPPGLEAVYPYRLPPLAPGQEVVVRGVVRRPRPGRFPGAFPEWDVYTRWGISGIVHVPHLRHVSVLEDEPREGEDARAAMGSMGPMGSLPSGGRLAGRFHDLALNWRRQVEDALQRSVEDEAVSALLRSLLFGDRSLLDPAFSAAVQRSGLAHLLAVSGLHVGFVAGLVGGIAGWLRLPPRLAWPLGSLAVLLYVLAAGAQPPAIRAGISILLALLAQAVDRQRDGFTSMGTAALILVSSRPADVLGLSFRLSFLAAMAIGLTARALQRWREEPRAGGGWRRFPRRAGRWLTMALAMSTAAQAATAPLIWGAFGEMSLLGLLANVPAVPLAALTVPLALLGATLEGVWPLPAAALMGLAGWGARGLIFIVETVAQLPVDPLPSPLRSPFSVLAWYGLLALLAVLILPAPPKGLLERVDWRMRRIPLLTAWSAALALLAAGWLTLPGILGPALEIYFLDVGQGLAALVRTSAGQNLLIDGGRGSSGHPGQDGYDAGRRVVLPALEHLGVRRLDAVIYTHADDDHLGGLVDVMEALPVAAAFGPLWPAPGDDPSAPSPGEGPVWDRFQRTLVARGIPHRRLGRGTRLHLGPELVLEVLHPGPEPVKGSVQGRGSETNDNSLVLLLRFREATWLFTGDLERLGQVDILAAGLGPRIAAQGFQVPHHGAAGAYWTPFWEAVNPQVAVISVGRNHFGQPAPVVLQALERKGIATYRTDRDGTVRAWTRGRGWRVAVSR